MRWVLFSLSLILAVAGAISFLVETLRPAVTLVLLLLGATGVIWTTWFYK